MPRVVVRFSRNPSEESESLIRQAETSRNVQELARLYQWGSDRGIPALVQAVEKRVKQLGGRISELHVEEYGILRRNLTDRAQRYRANAEPPEGPKQCIFCGSRTKIMVGHLDGFESHNEPENLVWTCRSCNTLHANALKRSGMGKRTAQFNPSKSGGASNLGEWMQAVGAIRPHKYPDKNAGLTSTMKTSDAVAMIRATPAYRRSEFASKLASSRSGRRGGRSSEVPF